MKQIRPHTQTCTHFLTQSGFQGQYDLYTYICTQTFWRHEPHNCLTAISFLSLSLFLKLLTLWLVLDWHFSPRLSPKRVGCMLAHARVFFQCRKKHFWCLRPSFYMVLTQSLDPNAHNLFAYNLYSLMISYGYWLLYEESYIYI